MFNNVSFHQLLQDFSATGHFSRELAVAVNYHVSRHLHRKGITDPEVRKAVFSRVLFKLAQMQQQQASFFKSLPTRSKSSAVAYLNCMSKTATADYFREQEPADSYDELLSAEEGDGHLFQGALEEVWKASARQADDEDVSLIRDAMTQLSPRQHLLCTRYYFDGVKLETLKEQVGLSLGMVHKELKKSLGILRQLLGVDIGATG